MQSMIDIFVEKFRSRHQENFQFKYDFIYVYQAEELFPSRDREAFGFKGITPIGTASSLSRFDLVIEVLFSSNRGWKSLLQKLMLNFTRYQSVCQCFFEIYQGYSVFGCQLLIKT